MRTSLPSSFAKIVLCTLFAILAILAARWRRCERRDIHHQPWMAAGIPSPPWTVLCCRRAQVNGNLYPPKPPCTSMADLRNTRSRSCPPSHERTTTFRLQIRAAKSCYLRTISRAVSVAWWADSNCHRPVVRLTCICWALLIRAMANQPCPALPRGDADFLRGRPGRALTMATSTRTTGVTPHRIRVENTKRG